MSDNDLEECWSLVRPTPVPRPPAANPADKVYVGKAKYLKESWDHDDDHDDDADNFDDLDDDNDDNDDDIWGDTERAVFTDAIDPRAAGPLIDAQGNVVDPENMEMAPHEPTRVDERDLARIRAAEDAVRQALAELGDGAEGQAVEDRALAIMEAAFPNPAPEDPRPEMVTYEEWAGSQPPLTTPESLAVGTLTRAMGSDTGEQLVRLVGDALGYGRMMQLCEQFWRERLEEIGTPGGELTHLHLTGPCASLMVPCPAPQHQPSFEPTDDNDVHCDWCRGAGRVTERVAQAIREQAPDAEPPSESSPG